MRVRTIGKYHDAPYISPEKEYYVFGLDHESFRILDDENEPALYPKNLFVVTDDAIPVDWVWNRYSEDEYYADPPGLHEPGFYEDYFDGKQEAIQRFDAYVQTCQSKMRSPN